MKYLITESQGSRLKNQLTQSFDEIGFVATINRYRLSIPQLDIIYKNSRLPEFSCDDLNEICSVLIYDTVVRKKYITEKYHIWLDMDDFVSTVYFKVTDKKKIVLTVMQRLTGMVIVIYQLILNITILQMMMVTQTMKN